MPQLKRRCRPQKALHTAKTTLLKSVDFLAGLEETEAPTPQSFFSSSCSLISFSNEEKLKNKREKTPQLILNVLQLFPRCPEFHGTEIWYKGTPQDFELCLGVDLLIKPEDGKEKIKDKDQIQQRAVVKDECPKCLNRGLEFYMKQSRSPDEGQIMFYECPKCHDKFSQNM